MHKKPPLIPILIILTLSTTLPVTAQFNEWKYHRAISIHENSGTTLTDYQVLLDLQMAQS
ncbi:MAG: hypothetical protein ACE5J3_07495 [Methanosarcinales archaeon]